MSQHFVAVNLSKRVSSGDFAAMVEAGGLFLRDFAASRGFVPSTIEAKSGSTSIPVGATPVYLLDNPDVAGAGGYHDVDQSDRPFCKVFVDPYLDNGGVVIASTEAQAENSVELAFTHELGECDLDEFCNLYAAASATIEYAVEASDACEAYGWPVRLASGRTVYVSDYLLAAFFSPGAPGPYDKMGRIPAPFAIGAGGYQIAQRLRGQPVQKTADDADSFDDPDDLEGMTAVPGMKVVRLDDGKLLLAHPACPDWKIKLKAQHGRASRRSKKRAR